MYFHIRKVFERSGNLYAFRWFYELFREKWHSEKLFASGPSAILPVPVLLNRTQRIWMKIIAEVAVARTTERGNPYRRPAFWVCNGRQKKQGYFNVAIKSSQVLTKEIDLNTQDRMPHRHDIELLRFTTCGSVDDGKSTLIGRLLLDTKIFWMISTLPTIYKYSEKDSQMLIWVCFTDGLKAEREQGITIDVAYRYFTTPKRKFIIAIPWSYSVYTEHGHRSIHSKSRTYPDWCTKKEWWSKPVGTLFIASLLRIPHVVVCINKMDLVDYSQDVGENCGWL